VTPALPCGGQMQRTRRCDLQELLMSTSGDGISIRARRHTAY